MSQFALHDAILAINADTSRYHALQGLDLAINEPLPIITGEKAKIDLSGSKIESDVPGGKLFVLDGQKVHIEGGNYEFFADQGLFQFRSAIRCMIENMSVVGSGEVGRWGSPGLTARRCWSNNIEGNFIGDGAIFAMTNAVNARMHQWNINGGGRNTHLGLIKPDPGAFLDTIAFTGGCYFQSFISGQIGSGADFGLDFNSTHGYITNVVADSLVLDHTTTAGLRFIGKEMHRKIHLYGVRNDADRNYCVQASNPTNATRDSIRLIAPYFHYHAQGPGPHQLGPNTSVAMPWQVAKPVSQ